MTVVYGDPLREKLDPHWRHVRIEESCADNPKEPGYVEVEWADRVGDGVNSADHVFLHLRPGLSDMPDEDEEQRFTVLLNLDELEVLVATLQTALRTSRAALTRVGIQT